MVEMLEPITDAIAQAQEWVTDGTGAIVALLGGLLVLSVVVMLYTQFRGK